MSTLMLILMLTLMPILMLTFMLILMLTLIPILMLTLMLILMLTFILIIIIIIIINVELDGAQSLSQYGQVSDVTDCEGNNKYIISVILMLGMKQ